MVIQNKSIIEMFRIDIYHYIAYLECESINVIYS